MNIDPKGGAAVGADGDIGLHTGAIGIVAGIVPEHSHIARGLIHGQMRQSLSAVARVMVDLHGSTPGRAVVVRIAHVDIGVRVDEKASDPGRGDSRRIIRVIKIDAAVVRPAAAVVSDPPLGIDAKWPAQ